MNLYQRQSWTLGSALRRAFTLLAEEGPRSLAFKLLGESLYRRLAIAELRLAQTPARTEPYPKSIAPLDANSLPAYLRFRTDLDAHNVAERLRGGHECYVTVIQDEVAQACWIAPGVAAWISSLECEIALAPRDFYIYEFYVAPAHRGTGLGLAAVHQLTAAYRERGYERLLWAWMPENRGAASLARRAGLRTVGLIGYWKFARWRKYFRRPAASEAIPPFSAPSPSWYLDPLVALQKRQVHQQWIRAAVGRRPCSTVLKTDLFEEAYGADRIFHDLFPTMRLGIGVDLDAATVSAALHRDAGAYTGLVCDVRRLPLPCASVDIVVSTSTLDHFADKREIAASLDELTRVLRPEGTLVITLDNPRNPLYSLLRILTRRGWSSFSLGATLSLAELAEMLRERGFRIEQRGYLIHNPRLLSTALFLTLRRLLGRRADTPVAWLLRAFASLGNLPTRSFTGCFLAVSAVKQAHGGNASSRN